MSSEGTTKGSGLILTRNLLRKTQIPPVWRIVEVTVVVMMGEMREVSVMLIASQQ